MQVKRIIMLLIVAIVGLTITACSTATVSSNQNDSSDKVVVYTTIYPLYDFTQNIGKEHVEVVNLIPPGAEPHSWEPSPKDIAKLQNADVFIYSGAGLEPWVDEIISSFGDSKPLLVDSSSGIPVDDHSGLDDHHHTTDPHIWLDPLNAKIQVKNITESLIKVDSLNKEDYQSNEQQYLSELDTLHRQYESKLAVVPNKKFITSHDAFGYLATRYQLEQIAIRGLSPELEPSPARLAELSNIAKENNIEYIFFESMVSPKVSNTLAEEISGGTLILNTIGSVTDEEFKAGKGYIDFMQENLDNLLVALGGTNEK
jgi:zinc transport system substrate-binding protein